VFRSSVSKGEKNVPRKTDFSGTKNLFGEKSVGQFLMQELCTLSKLSQNSASFDTLCGQFQRIFFNSYI
jgi:hypothetical protein